MNKKFIIAIAIFIILAGFSAWYIYRDLKPAKVGPSPTPDITEEKPVDETDVKHPVSNTNISSGEESIKRQMPDLNREIIVKVELPENIKNKAIMDIKIYAAQLREDYNQLELWLDLGLLRKLLGDYEGAGQAWRFATIIRPKDPVAYHNLGDLYAQYLIDFQKAEENYKKAIEKDTQNRAFFYAKLYEFYLYFVKKPDLAKDILEKGIKATDDPYLKSLLEENKDRP